MPPVSQGVVQNNSAMITSMQNYGAKAKSDSEEGGGGGDGGEGRILGAESAIWLNPVALPDNFQDFFASHERVQSFFGNPGSVGLFKDQMGLAAQFSMDGRSGLGAFFKAKGGFTQSRGG